MILDTCKDWARSCELRFCRQGESRGEPSAWIRCLPDLNLSVWIENGTYFIEHVPVHMRSHVERSIYADLLADKGGLVLHSSGIIDSASRVFLFVGPSGIGKSTVADNSGYRLISDDTVFILPAKGIISVRGTSYGKRSTTFDGTIKEICGICFLGQAENFKCYRISAKQTLSSLFPALFLPPTNNMEKEPTAPVSVIKTLMNIAHLVPAWKLNVPLGYKFNAKHLYSGED